jgi:hypothetical protein
MKYRIPEPGTTISSFADSKKKNHHVASSSRKLEKDISLDKIRFQPTSDEIGPLFPPP